MNHLLASSEAIPAPGNEARSTRSRAESLRGRQQAAGIGGQGTRQASRGHIDELPSRTAHMITAEFCTISKPATNSQSPAPPKARRGLRGGVSQWRPLWGFIVSSRQREEGSSVLVTMIAPQCSSKRSSRLQASSFNSPRRLRRPGRWRNERRAGRRQPPRLLRGCRRPARPRQSSGSPSRSITG